MFTITSWSITTSGNSAGSWYQERPFNSECFHLGYRWHQEFIKTLALVVQLLGTRGIRVHALRGGGGREGHILYLFQLLDKLAIILVPTHLQGARNVTADALSWLDSPSPTEWRLPLGTSNSLFSAFRAVLMNMFATAENKVTPIYVSPYADDIAWAVKAISISWDDLGLIYAFHPAPIVPQTLERIRTSWGTTLHRSIHHGHGNHSCYN